MLSLGSSQIMLNCYREQYHTGFSPLDSGSTPAQCFHVACRWGRLQSMRLAVQRQPGEASRQQSLLRNRGGSRKPPHPRQAAAVAAAETSHRTLSWACQHCRPPCHRVCVCVCACPTLHLSSPYACARVHIGVAGLWVTSSALAGLLLLRAQYLHQPAVGVSAVVSFICAHCVGCDVNQQ